MREKIKNIFLLFFTVLTTFIFTSLYMTEQGRELLDQNNGCIEVKTFQFVLGDTTAIGFSGSNKTGHKYILNKERLEEDNVIEFTLVE